MPVVAPSVENSLPQRCNYFCGPFPQVSSVQPLFELGVLQEANRSGHLERTWQDLDETDSWQDKYFVPDHLASADVNFWS